MNVYNNAKGRSRAWICAFYLGLLAACGYLGGLETPVQTVNAAVVRSDLNWSQEDGIADENTAEQLNAERKKEMDMLRAIAESDMANESTRAEALAQLEEIIERMECELQANTCLAEMGFEGVQAICGAQMMTLLMPWEKMEQDAQRVRVIEAVSSLTGLCAEDIKIIITKK